MHYGTGQIVVGYQGVGKSTLAYHNRNVIDLESSNFFVDGKRDEKWYIPYCNIARSLARQGYIVCVSSHEVVRKELERNPTERQVIVYPALALKDAWIRSLKHRYEQTENGTRVIAKEFAYRDVKFGDNSDWKASPIRKTLNNEYFKKIVAIIGEKNILSMDRDLTSLDGLDDYGTCTDKVSLLTAAEYAKYHKVLGLKSNYPA